MNQMKFTRLHVLALCACLLAFSCKATHPTQADKLEAGLATECRLPAADRIIAIGDTHGDLAVLQQALKKGGAVDDNMEWAGGTLVVVITGDILDRGPDELAMLDLVARLQEEASAVGGAVHMLNGNHELVNAQLIFRYVEEDGFAPFQQRYGKKNLDDSFYEKFPEKHRGRAYAFRPGGPLAMQLSKNLTALIIGDNLFVHGGVRPEHVVQGLDKMNRELSQWLAGKRKAISPRWINKNAPIWVRDFSLDTDAEDCKNLETTLALLKVKRMVVGHTIQDHINSACDGKVWRVDVGMNRKHYGGPVEVLEITGEGARPIQ